MSSIFLKSVSVEFPVYDVNARSLKQQFVRLGTGGMVSAQANQRILISGITNLTQVFHDGDRVGLIGHNGAGKTTLLRLLAGIYEPTCGRLEIRGKVAPLLDLGHGLQPELTGVQCIVTRGILLGYTRAEIIAKVAEIAEMTGLGDYINMPVRSYSAGMFMRLAFAVATCVDADILLIDEVFGAGDADFARRAKKRMSEMLDRADIVVFASHSFSLVRENCNKVMWMDGGSCKMFGACESVLSAYTDSIAVE